MFGKDAAFIIRSFEKEKLRQLLRLILKLYQCGSSVYLFREVMRYLYPDSLVYASNEDVRQILIYVGRKETETEQKKLEFLQGMFLPIYYHVFIFWEHHFGIIDVEETMELDHMVFFRKNGQTMGERNGTGKQIRICTEKEYGKEGADPLPQIGPSVNDCLPAKGNLQNGKDYTGRCKPHG